MNIHEEPKRPWPLIVAPEHVMSTGDVNTAEYMALRPCFLLVTKSKELSILGSRCGQYAIELERAGEKATYPGHKHESDWLDHLLPRLDPDVLPRLPSVFRQALSIVGLSKYIPLFSDYNKNVIDEATTERN